MAPGPRRTRHRSGFLRGLVLVALAAALALLGPKLTDAYTALQWTRHYALQTPDAVGESTRGAARSAVQTLAASAPLPWGAEACRLALDVGARQEASNPAASLALYEQVGKAMDTAVATGWRGWGLAGLREEARQREAALRARPDVWK